MAKVEVDPHGLSAKDPGAKLDAGKSPVFQGFVEYFPRAMRAVANISDFGAKKYAWGGWAAVPDGITRYTNAMLRHLTGETIDEGGIDPETGLLHMAQTAWNAMARLEKQLREDEQKSNPVEIKQGPTCDNCDQKPADFLQDDKWAALASEGPIPRPLKPLAFCRACADRLNIERSHYSLLTR